MVSANRMRIVQIEQIIEHTKNDRIIPLLSTAMKTTDCHSVCSKFQYIQGQLNICMNMTDFPYCITYTTDFGWFGGRSWSGMVVTLHNNQPFRCEPAGNGQIRRTIVYSNVDSEIAWEWSHMIDVFWLNFNQLRTTYISVEANFLDRLWWKNI